jgi:hypothetical protein
MRPNLYRRFLRRADVFYGVQIGPSIPRPACNSRGSAYAMRISHCLGDPWTTETWISYDVFFEGSFGTPIDAFKHGKLARMRGAGSPARPYGSCGIGVADGEANAIGNERASLE